MAVLCDWCLPLIAGSDLVTVCAWVLAVGAVGWLLMQGRSMVLSMDRERVRDDLRLRGAVLVELTPNGSGDRNERGYEVMFQMGDGSARTSVCKTNAASGVWWQGEVPPPLPPPALQGPGAAAPEEAAAEEPPMPDGLASAPLTPLLEPLEAELAWDAPSPDREYEGDLPGRSLRPVAELLEVLRGGESRACEQAVAELARHGPSVLPELEQASRDPDPDFRVDVKKAIDLIRGT